MQKHLRLLLICLSYILLHGLHAQKWDTLAPVPERLTFAVASVLNGQIHLIGGGGTSGASYAHYRYDPATNTWDTRAALPYRSQQPAGAAVNGKIHHFGGGYPNTGTPLADHYIYDPVADSWTAGASLTAPRAIHSAVGLNGQLYSLGGQGMSKLVQVYDATNNGWVNKNDLPDNSFWYGAHVVAMGKIYRFGGGGYTAPVNFAHEYNSANDNWTAIPTLPNATHAIKGAAIGNKIFLAGGYYNFEDRKEVLIYDIDAQTYSPSTPLPRGRSYHNMVAIDSCIYVIGGNNAIDPDVSFQLLRLCPFETSGVKTAAAKPVLAAFYDGAKLKIQVPQSFTGESFQLRLLNPAGQLAHSCTVNADPGGLLEVPVEGLTTSVYFIQLQTEKALFHGKVFLQF